MAMIDKIKREKLNKIAKKYKIADIYFFGSRVEGFEREDSDFDIAIRFERDKMPKIKERMKVYGNLFADLTSCLKEKVDLVFIEEVPLHFQFKIINNGKLIYSNNFIDSANFQEKTVINYLDYKYFIDDFFQGILETSAKL